MAIYVVMEPGETELDRAQEKAILVRDGFSSLAFILPFVWLLAHRLWIEALAAFALMLLAGVLAAQMDSPLGLGTALSVLTSLYFGLEGSALRLAALRRRGFREWGPLEARTQVEAELRYATYADEDGAMENGPWTKPAQASAQQRPASSLGLVTYPWTR